MVPDELQLVDWLRRRQSYDPRVALGIGDDMAVLAPQKGFLLIASDMMLDGVHFDSARHDLSAIGRKALACNLSDCAAMAAKPLAATVSLALPRTMDLDRAKLLFEGMFQLAAEFEMCVAGGDTTRWNHPLVIDVAITATAYPHVDPVTRFRARPGDRIYVTGKLGGSLPSGRHLSFTPRVREALRIAETLDVRLHAMMDISDGISLDLWRLCHASGVGAVLQEAELRRVIHDDVLGASTSPQQALGHALSDGEDYELLLAVEPGTDVAGLDLWPVGEITPDGFRMCHPNGTESALEPRGFLH